jgi:hypothetical protein
MAQGAWRRQAGWHAGRSEITRCALVGGKAASFSFVVRKSDAAVAQRVIADKRRMTVPAPRGTHEVDVPRFLRPQASLSDEQVSEMAMLALALEATMGHPVDVEAAFAGGELYLLQCRPITTLASAASAIASSWSGSHGAAPVPAPAPVPPRRAGLQPAASGPVAAQP